MDQFVLPIGNIEDSFEAKKKASVMFCQPDSCL